MSKRILHVFGAMNRGGAEIRTLSLMAKMRDKDVYFDFCVLSGQKGVLDSQIRDLGGHIYYYKLGPRFVFHFINLLRSQRFAGVHSHVAYVSGFILFLAFLARIRTRIAHFRNTTDGAAQTVIRKSRNVVLKWLINVCSTHILGVCKGALSGFLGDEWKINPKCQVIYNGFDLVEQNLQAAFWTAYIPNYNNQQIIINVARMDVQKNHLRQCTIFAEYLKFVPNALLVLIGKEDKTRKEQVERLLNELNISNQVIFLGLQSNVLPFLQHANAMLFPSLWEGLPGAVLEAASVGLPVLASDLPGVLEIKESLSCVSSVNLGCKDEEWASVLLKVIETGDSKQAIAEFAKSVFLIDSNVEQLYAIYQQ